MCVACLLSVQSRRGEGGADGWRKQYADLSTKMTLPVTQNQTKMPRGKTGISNKCKQNLTDTYRLLMKHIQWADKSQETHVVYMHWEGD